MSEHLHRVRVVVDVEVWGEARLGTASDVAITEVTKLLESYYPTNVRVLDAGCGDEGLSDRPHSFFMAERDDDGAIPVTPSTSSRSARSKPQ